MTVLKWVLVIFGVLFLAGAAAMVGIFYWASNVPTVQVTEADLTIGGSYPPEEKQMAQDACDLLNRRGVLCTVETGLYYAPNWYAVVGITGFDRVRNSPEYEAYVAKIQQISSEFAGTSKFKKFEPRALKWREPVKPQPSR